MQTKCLFLKNFTFPNFKLFDVLYPLDNYLVPFGKIKTIKSWNVSIKQLA